MKKILSKVLAAKLNMVLGSIVPDNQIAFVSGRNITDGVLIVNKSLALARRDKRSCVVLKVDFEKAYDSVS